jgi:hypothetical protein
MYTSLVYGSEYQQQSVSAYTIIFETTGAVTVSATSSEPLCEKIVSKITLQEASSGSSFYSDSSQSTKTKTAKGGTIRHNTNFSLEKNKDYRVKVTLTDYFSGTSVSKTYYKYL